MTRCLVLLVTFALLHGSSTYASEKTSVTVDLELRDFLKQSIHGATSFKDRFDAEVWLVGMSGRLERYVKDAKRRITLLESVHREATAAGLKPGLVLAVIETESHFDHFAISSAGAQGLMQVMPFWRNEIGRPDDNLTDIDTNLRYGCRILQFYLKKEKGHVARALARYNGSVGKTKYPEKVMVAWQRTWSGGDF